MSGQQSQSSSCLRKLTGLPLSWLRCPIKSLKPVADRFVVFKTPVSDELNSKLPEESRFSAKYILDYFDRQTVMLALWVDLTNQQSRFYDLDILLRHNVRYTNIDCGRNNEIPTRKQIAAFNSYIWDFMMKEPFNMIGVHSMHGFNRTGFMICSFLIERMDCDVPLALDMYAQSRPPGIFKQSFITELFHRYGKPGNVILLAPPRPQWADGPAIPSMRAVTPC